MSEVWRNQSSMLDTILQKDEKTASDAMQTIFFLFFPQK
jgi:hypothetical protein